jgi:hypothetical protein
MRAGLTLTANFIPNPFLDHKGVYNGLLSTGDAEHATSGIVKVAVGATGAVSAKVLLGSATYAVKGQLNGFGDATFTIARSKLPPLTLTLNLDLDGGSDRISGTLTDGSFSATFDADRGLPTGSAPRDFAGRYTVSLPGNSGSATPDGSGWAVLSITSKGVGSMIGRLADGSAISAAAYVSSDGVMPIFRVLYSSTGSISGSLQIRETSSTDLDGSFYWHKPWQTAALRYPAAFDVEHSIVGSRYTAPATRERVIPLEAVAGNAAVALDGGDLDSTLWQTVTVTGVNSVKPIAPFLKGFSAAIKPTNGCFSGTFTDPADNKVRRFEGVFLQKQNAGFGFFLGAEQSGVVEFSPSGQ